MLNVTIDLKGTRPMLMHNGRLANPLDPLTRQVAGLAAKRKKTTDDYQLLLSHEALAGCWETPDGRLGLPTENVWASLYQAAKAFKLGQLVKRALLFDGDEVSSLRVNGKEVNAKAFVHQPDGQNMFIRTVNVNGRKVLRARPIVRNWESTHAFALLDDVMDTNDLGRVLEYAARLVGVGDWRPLYGRYEVTNVVATEAELAA